MVRIKYRYLTIKYEKLIDFKLAYKKLYGLIGLAFFDMQIIYDLPENKIALISILRDSQKNFLQILNEEKITVLNISGSVRLAKEAAINRKIFENKLEGN